jgi:hypothetical protein
MPTFATPAPIAAAVQVAGARVRVTASDRTDTVVRVEPVDPASAAHARVAGKTRVDFADGQLSVKTTVSGDKNGSVVITIDLPAGSGLVANLGHSSVHADGTLGECELRIASGQVQLDRISTLKANVADGAVTIGQVAGRAIIGGSTVTTRIGHATADLALTGGSGSFDIDRADGGVTATTGDGAIRIGRLTRGRAELMNRSGTIEVGISEGSAARVDASSERSTVRNTAPSPDDSGPFDNEVTVHARTRYGDIVIQPAAG